MMHPVDRHKVAAEKANEELRAKFGTDTFKIGSPEHDFWLRQFDVAYFRSYDDEIKVYALRGVQTVWGKS